MANESLMGNLRTSPNGYNYFSTMADYGKRRKMHGAKRVVVFLMLIVLLPVTLILIPLHLRRRVFADFTYAVAESDIIEIRNGISSIFCSQHSLHMDSHFNAFQLRNKPEVSSNRKHIRLKKSMTLPDDTLEYWGFYLLKGSMVHVKFCSRYDGSRILVVRGARQLQTCGLFDHAQNKIDTNMARDHEKVQVFFEDMTEIVETSKNYSSASFEDLMNLENNAAENFDADNDGLKISVLNLKATFSDELNFSASKNNKSSKSKYESESVPGSDDDKIVKTPVKKVNHKKVDSLEEYTARKQKVYNQLYKHSDRVRRDHVYNRKYSHGGNAINFTEATESNSISSFEADLIDCYNGDILLAEGFPPSIECTNAHYLENGSHRMLSKHEITIDGYYYYIFYSDNDLVRNDIHAIFDIYKPTFQYSNLSNSNCISVTNCTFNMTLFSNDIVIVEIPTRDGIEHEEDNIAYLISTCHPRSEVYAIFPILVVIIILSCSSL